MLPSLSLNHYSRSVETFAHPDSRRLYDMNPSYQRPSVWDDGRRRDLIKSLLMGLPIGVIILNDRGYDSDVAFGLVDGKQRIEALLKFYDGELLIPAEWLDPSWIEETVEVNGEQMIRYSGMSLKGQRKLRCPALRRKLKCSC